jgi:hypothetical protein
LYAGFEGKKGNFFLRLYEAAVLEVDGIVELTLIFFLLSLVDGLELKNNTLPLTLGNINA